jgi:hypothetical protein
MGEIEAWIQQSPERIGAFAFMAAKAMTRHGLAYGLVFDRCLKAAVDAGRSEAAARLWVFRGFAAEAAKHAEPPAYLEESNG